MIIFGTDVDNTIVITVVTSVAAIVTAIVSGIFSLKQKKIETELKETKKEVTKMKIELSCINILFNHDFLQVLSEKVDEIFENTHAERFLILFAVNGKERFNYVTVCYERTKTHSGSGAIYRYVRFEIDDHYRDLLHDSERHNAVVLNVEEMPNSYLKSIYQTRVESIRHAVIKFLKRMTVDTDNDLVIYSSIATTLDRPFNDNELTIIKTAFDVLRATAKNVTFSNHY